MKPLPPSTPPYPRIGKSWNEIIGNPGGEELCRQGEIPRNKIIGNPRGEEVCRQGETWRGAGGGKG